MKMKFYWNNNGHITKMAAIPVYGKIHFKILYPGYNDTLYVASGTPAHHNLFKLWPWVDLDLFLARSNFWT